MYVVQEHLFKRMDPGEPEQTMDPRSFLVVLGAMEADDGEAASS